jgi:two-component system, cell cycle sensor histidine kinase and response regulator CckA
VRDSVLPTTESILALVLSSVEHAIFVIDSSGRTLHRNRAAEALTGPAGAGPAWWLTGAELLGADNTPLLPEELPSSRALRGETVTESELVWKSATLPQGVSLVVSAAPIRQGLPQPVGAVVVLRDLGAYRRAQAAGERDRVFLDSIVENIPHMIFVKDADKLSFELFNRAGEELLGMSRETLIGKSDFDFFPAEQARFFQERDRETLRSGRLVDVMEEPISTAHGERWLHTKKIPILDARGEPKYLLGISEDITERKAGERLVAEMYEDLENRVAERTAELSRTNDELRRQISDRERAESRLEDAQEQLLQAQKMEAVGRLAGGVAHDFNNMLSVILSHTRLAMADLMPGHPLLEDLEQVNHAAERAAQITRQLLAYSRRQIMQPRTLDLNAVLRETEKMLRRLIGEDIDLNVVLAADLWTVHLDPGQIQQVLMNLVVNARDAMPKGGRLTIETSNVTLDPDYALDHPGIAPGRHVMLAVTDSGVGMDSETQSRIFDPFFTTKGGEHGTGLGLSTVYGIVKQSGGHVWVYSELGLGSTFKVYFPESAGSGHHRAVKPRADELTGKETVLLVEDEDLVRRAVRAILRRGGYQILEAASGRAALELLETHQGSVDLLITDVVMPETSGRELALKVAELRPEIKVLYMSGYTDDTIVRHGVLEASMAFIQKPATPDDLLRKIREVLDETPGAH